MENTEETKEENELEIRQRENEINIRYDHLYKSIQKI